MKKVMSILFILLLMISVLIGGYVVYKEQFVANTLPLSVMVDDMLYFTSGTPAKVPDSPEPVGYIQEQSTGIDAVPSKNDTSNFSACVGQPYIFVDGNLILYYNGQWNTCYPESEYPSDMA